jgi:hypothetical protein
MRTLPLLRTLALIATLPVLFTACGGTGDDDDTTPAFDTTAGSDTGAVKNCRNDLECVIPQVCVDNVCVDPGSTGTDTSSTGPGGNVTDGGDDDTTTTTTGGSSGDDGTGTETDTTSTTTGPVGDCRSDADCFFPTPICLRASGLCVECLSAADCDAGESCIDNACSFGTETDGTDGSETTGNTDIGCPAEKDCRGLECGADPVCGLSCGTCKSGYICQFGSCVVSDNAVCPADKDCTGRVCGLDPVCGTSCGTCDSGSYCSAGQCKQGSPKCPQETNCDGRECGTDPNCGASCGSCGAVPADKCVNSVTLWQYKGGGFCNTSAQCQYNNYTEKNCPYGCADGECQACKPSCSGKVCGDDGCGGTCGSCNTPPANVCQSGTKLRKYSGASTCSGAGQCNYTFTDVTCTTGCANGKCQGCEPDCSGRVCGPDPVCGTSCGGCTGTDTCNAAGQCKKPVGCSDGSAEGGNGTTFFMCQGNWDQPGVDADKAPTCSRASGNTGTNKNGTGCSASDLCAVGYKICDAANALALGGSNACSLMTVDGAYWSGQRFDAVKNKCSGSLTRQDSLGCAYPGYVSPIVNPSNGDVQCRPFDGSFGGTNVTTLGPGVGDGAWYNAPSTTANAYNLVKKKNVTVGVQSPGGVLCCAE